MSDIFSKIKKSHTNSGIVDNEQIKVVFSNKDKIIVEAPAGYGKTKTLLSKIAYLISTKQLKNNEKILVLTFSVNAAYKIKKDVMLKLPKILEDIISQKDNFTNQVFSTNYHGFCRRILSLYGYLIDDNLRDIGSIKNMDFNPKNYRENRFLELNQEDKTFLKKFKNKIKKSDKDFIEKNLFRYKQLILEKFLPKMRITYDSIIIFVLELFDQYPEILRFYQKYYPILIVDEYQDTNILSFILLKRFISSETRVILLGDPLQRIYGFIGAVPDLMQLSKEEFCMDRYTLETNHRFENENMKALDKNIRKNAKNLLNPSIDRLATIKCQVNSNQAEEVENLLSLIKEMEQNNDKIAILCRSRGKNLDFLESKLEHVNYFNAVFSDEDEDYIKFHLICGRIFDKLVEDNNENFNSRLSNKFLIEVKNEVKNEFENNPIINSLIYLLDVFLNNVEKEYNLFSPKQQILLIKDALERKSLKQSLQNVKHNIILTTIHGAKGLEWDYVILPDLEKRNFPSHHLCESCGFQRDCNIDWNSVNEEFKKEYLDELNVFYVGATRSKRNNIFF